MRNPTIDFRGYSEGYQEDLGSSEGVTHTNAPGTKVTAEEMTYANDSTILNIGLKGRVVLGNWRDVVGRGLHIESKGARV